MSTKLLSVWKVRIIKATDAVLQMQQKVRDEKKIWGGGIEDGSMEDLPKTDEMEKKIAKSNEVDLMRTEKFLIVSKRGRGSHSTLSRTTRVLRGEELRVWMNTLDLLDADLVWLDDDRKGSERLEPQHEPHPLIIMPCNHSSREQLARTIMELEIEDLMESESDSDREEDILLLHDLYTKHYLFSQSSINLSKTYSPEDLM
ncbi:hypothetical protein PPACK8108_LOCUS1653 [Phakopsora pachyrhizi]|uniref:Uncharacterized protein n=1 Tax=Phakopsora pachyrhizi TaxID=170000 RepID=A0AAV0AGV8_PHAPC|nr:hypothetical protein PPACK8108_LOCUS1653 [Phakopsora pachyrhizi]